MAWAFILKGKVGWLVGWLVCGWRESNPLPPEVPTFDVSAVKARGPCSARKVRVAVGAHSAWFMTVDDRKTLYHLLSSSPDLVLLLSSFERAKICPAVRYVLPGKSRGPLSGGPVTNLRPSILNPTTRCQPAAGGRSGLSASFWGREVPTDRGDGLVGALYARLNHRGRRVPVSDARLRRLGVLARSS